MTTERSVEEMIESSLSALYGGWNAADGVEDQRQRLRSLVREVLEKVASRYEDQSMGGSMLGSLLAADVRSMLPTPDSEKP